jgi:hypothetical protein
VPAREDGHFTVNVSINTLRTADRLVDRSWRRAAAARTPSIRCARCSRVAMGRAVRGADPRDLGPADEVDWKSGVPRGRVLLGTIEHDLVSGAPALINKVCDEIGVNRDNVVMYGASSGGTSAILVGSRRREKTGIIAACPFLRPDKYAKGSSRRLRALSAAKLADWERITTEEPWRVSPLTALRDASPRATTPRGGGAERAGQVDHQPHSPASGAASTSAPKAASRRPAA